MRIPRTIALAAQIIVALVVLTLLVMAMSGLFNERVSPDDGPIANVAPAWDGAAVEVRAATQTIVETAAGSIQAARRTAVSSNIMARITEMKVNAGDTVQAGDVLVELDDRDLQSRVEQARQQVASAKASLDRAQADYTRVSNLYARDAVARNQLDAANEDLNVARAAHERAQRMLEESRVALDYARIVSPVTGRVVERLADTGDTAAPGQPLVEVYDPRALRLEVPVRESLATRLRIGAAVDVHIDALDETFDGHIHEVVPQADVGARAFVVKVVLPPDERLYTGMFGRLLLEVGERRRTLVPQAAISHIGQLSFVQVLSDADRPQRRMVTLGASSGHEAEVLSGLTPGERVALPEP